MHQLEMLRGGTQEGKLKSWCVGRRGLRKDSQASASANGRVAIKQELGNHLKDPRFYYKLINVLP